MTQDDGGSGGTEWTRKEALRRCGQVISVECRVQQEFGKPDWAWCIDAIHSLECRPGTR